MSDATGGIRKASTVRPLIGAIVAPLAALVIYAGMILARNLRNPNLPPYALNFFIGQVVHGTFVNAFLLSLIYGLELVLGLPFYLHFKKERITSFGMYLFAGTFIALAPAAIAGYLVAGRLGLAFNISLWGLPAVTFAAIFWLIARPDRG